MNIEGLIELSCRFVCVSGENDEFAYLIEFLRILHKTFHYCPCEAVSFGRRSCINASYKIFFLVQNPWILFTEVHV